MFAGIKRDDFHFNYTKAGAKHASFLAKEILTASIMLPRVNNSGYIQLKPYFKDIYSVIYVISGSTG